MDRTPQEKVLLPVKPLGHLFRGKFLAFLEEAFAAHSLDFYGRIRELAHPVRFAELVSALRDKDWVVYAKPPLGGPQHVLQYLARSTIQLGGGEWVFLTPVAWDKGTPESRCDQFRLSECARR